MIKIANIGICGSHRSGKTTLAKTLAERLSIQFAQTITSDVFKKNGLDPTQTLDFKTRIWIQHKILDAGEEIWSSQENRFVTDRTPIDMMAYLLADIQWNTETDYQEIKKYLDRGFSLINKYFEHLIIVQPGIPLIQEPGKAPLNRSYMEHFNTLVIGLCEDERISPLCNVTKIERAVLELERRLTHINRHLGGL